MRQQSSLYPFTRLGLGFALFLWVSHLAALLLSQLALRFSPELLASSWGNWILNDLSIFGFGLAALVLVIWTLPVYPPACRDRMTPQSFGAVTLAAFGVMYLSNFATLLLIAVMGAVGGTVFENPVAQAVSQVDFLPNFVFGVIAAPVLEELVFRKLLLERVRHWGDRLAILISALFFALYHANLYQLFYAFAVGAVFAYITLRTGTIRYAILLHAIVNLVGLGLLPLLELFPNAVTFLSGLWVLACLGLGSWQFWKFWRRRVFWEGYAPFSFSRKAAIFFQSPGTIAFVALALVFTLLNLRMV